MQIGAKKYWHHKLPKMHLFSTYLFKAAILFLECCKKKKERIRHCLYWHLLKNEQNKMSNGKDEVRAQPSNRASICQEFILCWLKRRGSWCDLSSLVLVTAHFSKRVSLGEAREQRQQGWKDSHIHVIFKKSKDVANLFM